MRALIVDTDTATLASTTHSMCAAGHGAASASCFEEAKRYLETESINVLVVQQRLGPFNGVHLLHLARWANPHLVGVVLTRERDAILEKELTRIGGARTLAIAELAALVEIVEDLALNSHDR